MCFSPFFQCFREHLRPLECHVKEKIVSGLSVLIGRESRRQKMLKRCPLSPLILVHSKYFICNCIKSSFIYTTGEEDKMREKGKPAGCHVRISCRHS